MKDSVPHLALSLLLLVLVSTLPGELHKSYDNVLIWAAMLGFIVLSLDLLSLIGLRTSLIDWWLQGSLVKKGPNYYKNCYSLQYNQTTCEHFVYLFQHLIHVLGYVFCFTTIVFGYHFHKVVEHKKEDFTFEKCDQEGHINSERTTWRMIEMSLIFYPLLLLVLEAIKIRSTRAAHFGQKKTWINLVGIISSLTIALVSKHSNYNICKYPWIPNLIWMVILLSFSQLIDDIVDSIPNNDIVQVDIYRHIFYQVARTYLVIMLGFLPFLVAFAFCFQGIIW